MPIPDFQTLMLPTLKLLASGEPRPAAGVVEAIEGEFDLNEAERKQLLPSGRQTVIRNRIGWALTYMTKAGLCETVRRGISRITPRGREVLDARPVRIDIKFLRQFPEFVAFRETSHEKPGGDVVGEPGKASTPVEVTPEESLESAYQRLRSALEAEVLDLVSSSSPAFFERLVVEVLVKMGYGGTLRDAGQAIGKSGDGGVDGIIKEDRLGLDVIYIQAKRWENTVGRPEIQKFAGALQGHRARKGVFITTASFSGEALEYVGRIDSKIVLIDGEELARLMVEHGVGVTTGTVYEVKRIDSDFFAESV